MDDATILTNACVMDVVGGTISSEQNVLIRAGRVVDIGGASIDTPHARRIDLRGKVLMPGLCDAHVHVTVPMNSFLLLTKWSPFYAAIRALPILEGMLMRGFTTVRDGGGAEFGLARAVEEGLIPSPRILYCGKALSQTGGHGDMRGAGENVYDSHYAVPGLGRIANGVAEVRLAARDEIRRGAHHVKIMAGGGIASYTDPISNDQFSEEEICAVVEESRMANLYVMAHTYTARQVERCVRCGVRSVEHGNFIDDHAAVAVAKSDAFLVPTLVAYQTMWDEGLEIGMPPELHAKIKPVLDVGSRSLEVAQRHKLRMAYGTDLIGPLHRHQSLEFRIRAAVLPTIEVIRAATCYAADLFRMEGEIGVVAVGARADLIAVDGNPIEDIELLVGQGEKLRLIMKGGTVFKDETA